MKVVGKTLSEQVTVQFTKDNHEETKKVFLDAGYKLTLIRPAPEVGNMVFTREFKLDEVHQMITYWQQKIGDFNTLKDADASNYANSKETIYDIQTKMAKEFIAQLAQFRCNLVK